MGLIQAVSGSIGSALADQWKDFYTIPDGLPATAALFAAVPRGTNAGRTIPSPKKRVRLIQSINEPDPFFIFFDPLDGRARRCWLRRAVPCGRHAR